MWQDLILIYGCWFLLALWQLASLPLLYLLFKKRLADGGWAFGRLLIWLLLAVIVWFSAHLGLPTNQTLVFHGLFFIIFLFSLNWFLQHISEFVEYWRKKWRLILVEEGLFLLGFVGLSLVRAFKPDINGLEKFMDAGLINAYLRSPFLPIEDMWLAGEKVNYYTFGHFLGSVVTSFWDISLNFAYNLLLGLVMGLLLAEVFSVGFNLSLNLFNKNQQVKAVKAGLLAALLVVLAGNGHTIWFFVSHSFSFKGYWYPDATRFIERTIHEFPAYSFIVSDLHAHVWSMPLLMWLIINIFIWLKDIFKQGRQQLGQLRELINLNYVRRSAVIGATFGLIVSTSTWDVLIYGLLMLVLGFVLLALDTKYLRGLLSSAVVVGLTTLVMAAPWLLNFTSISEGVRLAQEHSPAWQLLVLWGPHWLLVVITFFVGSRLLKVDKDAKIEADWVLITTLVITASLLLALPELIYMKDIYPSHPRANTMFKLTFQAFIMMGLVISYFAGLIQTRLWTKLKSGQLLRRAAKLLLAVFIISVSIYPYFGYRDFYNGLKNYQGLNGLSWLQEKHPDDYLAIQWLKQNVQGRPVVLEAVGESYTEYARVSTFTGLPTVLGWRVHEWLWRGGFDIPGVRTGEVKAVYEQPESIQAQSALAKYEVKYIFIGDKEREQYQLALSSLLEQGRVVFSHNNTVIIKLN